MKTVVHIPHASTTVPDDVRDQFLLSNDELERELVLMTDTFTDELYGGMTEATDICFPVSRLVVDPERFELDADEPMATRGMGVIYQLTSDQNPLRRALAPHERMELIERFYRPHHESLTCAVRDAIQEFGGCLLLDCHSFPSTALPYELDQYGARPEICIGTDAFHTSAANTNLAKNLFTEAGFSVAINTPFSGALVPMPFYQSKQSIQALMIEIRRDLYMNEETAEKNASFDAFRTKLRHALKVLIENAAEAPG